MKNDLVQATKWLKIIYDFELPDKNLFKKHVFAGKITNLCNCGCNSFEIEIPSDADLEPLAPGNGLFFEAAFNTNKDDVVDFLVFTDDRGYLSGVDITYGFATHAPIPNGIELHECVHSQFN
ncbi:MAG: hypothetical protein GKR92_08750 [Gammaproteobacteria bacterium]|nr:MAG: hypothetical protein GKR92_08750 [Gammaproteobacteria bacterium]